MPSYATAWRSVEPSFMWTFRSTRKRPSVCLSRCSSGPPFLPWVKLSVQGVRVQLYALEKASASSLRLHDRSHRGDADAHVESFDEEVIQRVNQA